MSIFKKYLEAEAKKLQRKAEDEAKDEDKREGEDKEGDSSESGDSGENREKEANEMMGYEPDFAMTAEETEMASDPTLEAIGDAVEEFVQQIVEEAKEVMIASKARPEVNDCIIKNLNHFGVLVQNPYTNIKATKFTDKEKAFINGVVNAAVEAVEEVLRASAKALKKHKKGKKEATVLDKRYFANGYLRCSVASPQLRPEYRKAAEKAAQKTRNKKAILELE